MHDLSRRLEGNEFSYLLTRFTEPSELFGPFDIRKLRAGDLVTNTEGMLPEASLVFLDELLNANSAILNSLLTVLNERVFRRGRETRPLPLLMVVGASNHLPEDDALCALFDRFLVRVRCDNVPEDRLAEVMHAGWKLDVQRELRTSSVKIEDVRALSRLLGRVDLTAVQAPFVRLVQRMRHAGLAISDRRSVKIQKLVAASALLCHRLQAHGSDLWVFRYVWDTKEQQEVLASLVGETLSAFEDDVVVHPRARDDDHPDVEALARDLEQLAARLEGAREDAAAWSCLRDQLGVLDGRCQWVPDADKRGFLQNQVQDLWARFETTS